MDVPKHVLDMFFFQVSPFTDMKKRDGFWCVKTFIHTAFFFIR